jgi:hypothetical protein
LTFETYQKNYSHFKLTIQGVKLESFVRKLEDVMNDISHNQDTQRERRQSGKSKTRSFAQIDTLFPRALEQTK